MEVLKPEEVLEPEENQKLESIKRPFSKNMRTNEFKNEIREIRKWGEKIKQKKLKYILNKHLHDFQQF